MPSAERERKGCSLQHASSVGLVYLERDHAHFREIKELAKRLKDEFGVRRVGMMSFVAEEMKDTPTWLVKKLDSGYFCCLLYTSPSPRDRTRSRMPSSA